MRKIGKISMVVVAALAIALGYARPVTNASADSVRLARETQPGDDNGGHGRGGDDAVTARETQPGDDNGGHGRGGDDGVITARETQPGDDHGGHGNDDA